MRIKVFYDEVKVVTAQADAFLATLENIQISGSSAVAFPAVPEGHPDYLCIIIWYMQKSVKPKRRI